MFSLAVDAALAYAGVRHHGQVRRDSGAPYLVHLAHVGMLLARLGESEEVVIAGLLHDILEDTTSTPEETEAVARHIADRFGGRVISAVRALTEPRRAPDGSKIPWRERKRVYLAQLRSGGRIAHLVAAADKLHNLETLLHALDLGEPDEVWSWFTGDAEDTAWFYGQAIAILRDGLGADHPLVEALDQGLARLEHHRAA